MEAFGVEKEKRMGQDTARAAGRVLNPQEYVAEEFARAGKDRTAQVGNCVFSLGGGGVACVSKRGKGGGGAP